MTSIEFSKKEEPTTPEESKASEKVATTITSASKEEEDDEQVRLRRPRTEKEDDEHALDRAMGIFPVPFGDDPPYESRAERASADRTARADGGGGVAASAESPSAAGAGAAGRCSCATPRRRTRAWRGRTPPSASTWRGGACRPRHAQASRARMLCDQRAVRVSQPKWQGPACAAHRPSGRWQSDCR